MCRQFYFLTLSPDFIHWVKPAALLTAHRLHPPRAEQLIGEAAGMSRREDINFPLWQMAVMGDTVYKQTEHAAFHYLWVGESQGNGSAEYSVSFSCEGTQRARPQAPRKHDTGTRGKAMTHFCWNCALRVQINHSRFGKSLQNPEQGDETHIRKDQVSTVWTQKQ